MAKLIETWRAGGTGRGSYTFKANSAAQVPLILQGASGQTANLLEIKTYSGATVYSVDVSGNITNIGDNYVTDELTVNNNASILGTLNVTGATVLSTMAAGATVLDSLSVSGDTILHALRATNITATSNLTVDHFVYFNRCLYLSEQGTAPTQMANKGVIYTKDASTVTELFYKDSSGNEVQLTSAGSIGGDNVWIPDDYTLGFGNTAASPDATINWETADADAHYLGIALTTSRNIIISEDRNVDFGHAAQTNPTLWIHSADGADTADWINFTHNQTNAVIGVGTGGLLVDTAGNHLSPATTDSEALGTTALMWSDLYLASGAVVNFNNGDVTITHAANALSIDGGDTTFLTGAIIMGNATSDCSTFTMIKGAQTSDPQVQFALSADGNGNFSITADTGDITLTAADDFFVSVDGNIELALTGTALYPQTDGGLTLGITNTNEWGGLYMNAASAISWDNGNYTITHSAGLLTTNGALTITGALAGVTTLALSQGITQTTTVAGTMYDMVLETEWTGGTLINADFASATTQATDMSGIALDFNTNMAGVTDKDVTGMILKTPALTQTAANTTTYIGWNLPTAGALVQNTLEGTISWTGVNIQMPNITQTTGTVTSTGLKITGGTVTSGTSYGLIVDTNAGNVGIGTTAPGAKLHVAGDILIDRVASATTIGSTQAAIYLQDVAGNDKLMFGLGSGSDGYIFNNGNVGIGTTGPSALLNLKGTLSSALTGTVSVTINTAAVTGVGTAFTTELAVGDSIKIGSEIFTVSVITDNTNLTLDSNHTAGTSGATAYRDPTLFAIDNGDAVNKVTITKSGNVGIGTTAPTATLDVDGAAQTVTAVTQRVIINNTNAITTNTGATAVYGLTIDEPNINVGTATPTNSASLYISGAATEATNNYALWIDDGKSRFDAQTAINMGGSPSDSAVLTVGWNASTMAAATTAARHFYTTGNITELANATITDIVGAYFNTFTITDGAGTETVGIVSTVYIPNAPTVGSTPANGPYALFVDAGEVRIDGSLGDTTNRVLTGFFTDLTVTNGIVGSITGNAATVTVADTTDTSCYVALFEDASGSLAAKTDAGLTYNAGTGLLTATGFSGPLTGNVTGNCTGSSGTCTGNAGSATYASATTITDDTTTAATMYPLWVTANTGNLATKVSSTKLSFVPSTGILTATGFAGPLTGDVTGNCTGTSATVTGATQASITTCANLVTVGTIGTGVWQGTTIKANYLQQAAADLGDVDINLDFSNSNAGNVTNLTIDGAYSGLTYNSLTLTAVAIGFTIAGGTTSKTLTVPLDASVSGTNTGDNAANSSTMYIGTTAHALNRASAAETLAGITLTTPDIGTPSAGTLTNCTGLPVAGITASTSTALGVGSIELGHASDTTLSRSAAGVLAVEGVVIPSISSTNTLTNKRITQRVTTTTDDATAVIDTDTCDVYELSAVANATEFTLTGTPTDGQKLIVRVKDAGVSKALTWTGFTAIGVTLPVATTAGKWHYIGCTYNLAATAWHAIAVTEQA